MKPLALLFGSLLMAASPAEEIRELLTRQTADWNRGDVRAFMRGYDVSESTTFVGKEVTKGYQKVLASYLERYPTKAAMGKLDFSGVEVQPLGPAHAVVVAKWHLQRTAEAGGDTGGIFTLVLHKTASGWKIILDHTS